MPSRLTRLQERALAVLAEIDPAPTLTGGAALAGVHLEHRPTRDLDLFWHGRSELGHLGREATERLRRAGLEVDAIQTASTFQRLRVSDGTEVVVVDLVADPVATIEEPRSATIGGVGFQVDTAHEILVNKLCALVSRSELRDLVDLRALLGAGGDLDRALADAPRKDGGFSVLLLVWALKQLSMSAPGLDEHLLTGLEEYRRELLARLSRGSSPDALDQPPGPADA